jgi:replicative DNA helicase
MQRPDAIHAVIPILGEVRTVFFAGKNQLLYAAALRLTAKGNPIDLLTLAEELKASDDLARVGGTMYLYNIQESVPSAANCEYYAEIVRDRATRRALVAAASDILADAGSLDIELPQVVANAQKALFDASYLRDRGFAGFNDVLASTFAYIEEVYKRKGKLVGIPTGIPSIDDHIYGLNKSDLIIVAARPSMGKSAFAHNIAMNIAARDDEDAVEVALFTLEMGREQIMTRLLSTAGRIPMGKLRTGHLAQEDWKRMSQAAGYLENSRMHINDTPGITILEVCAEARRLKLRHPKLGVIILDYMQLLSGGVNANRSREQEISEYSRTLKELARELDVCVVALSQLNRAVEGRGDKRPMLSDLRESGAIEQDADIVMFLYRDDYYDEHSPDAGMTEIIIRKHRNGALGTINLAFTAEILLFEEMRE